VRAMVEFVKQILIGQFDASLCMMNLCVQACRPEHWEGKIANDTFRQVAYHSLFFTDLYLSPGEEGFKLRNFHHRGGDERGPTASLGLAKDETLSYLAICRQKMLDTIGSETPQSLEAPSGFSWLRFSRGELHVYNIRHLQHHTGQFSAYLRKVDDALKDPKALPWVRTGWR
jgi:hypothetical protein